MIMQTPERVMRFLKDCSQSIAEKANAEYNVMRRFKRNTFASDKPLMPWDVPFISNRIKASLFDVDKSQYMPYLSIGSCMEGLNMILNHLYKLDDSLVCFILNIFIHVRFVFI
jgi:intermediate peptidase